jgi:glucose/arabinose dehydrogenase
MGFDIVTGELWAGDVGEASREEVDIIEKGKNYGWPILEGVSGL